MIRVGIAGYGIMGQLHHLACGQHAGAEVVAVCNRSTPKLEKARAKGVKCLYTEIEEMLGKSELDLVIVALPDRHHYAAVMASLNAGCDVLVEKPMATTLAECVEMRDTARRLNLKLAANFSFRCEADFLSLRGSIVAGDLGDLSYVKLRVSDRIDVATGMIGWAGESSPTEFLMPHSIDLARWLTGQEIVEVYARKSDGVLKSRGIDTHDVMLAVARMSGGTMLLLESSWILPESYPSLVDFLIEIQGGKGGARLDRNETGISVYTNTYQRPIMWLSVLETGKGIGFFFDSVSRFLDWYSGKADSGGSSVDDAIRNTAVLATILESAGSGRTLSVPAVE